MSRRNESEASWKPNKKKKVKQEGKGLQKIIDTHNLTHKGNMLHILLWLNQRIWGSASPQTTTSTGPYSSNQNRCGPILKARFVHSEPVEPPWPTTSHKEDHVIEKYHLTLLYFHKLRLKLLRMAACLSFLLWDHISKTTNLTNSSQGFILRENKPHMSSWRNNTTNSVWKVTVGSSQHLLCIHFICWV